MKLAFLYAGQGTQHPGMGRDLYETYPAFRQVLDSAQLDFDLKELCFEGPEEKLSQTQYTQPCIHWAHHWGSSRSPASSRRISGVRTARPGIPTGLWMMARSSSRASSSTSL